MATNQYALVSLEEVKRFMNMSGAVAETDTLLESLIDSVSALVESVINRNILTREYTEYHSGRGISVLFPHQSPITEVTSIHDDSEWLWEAVDLISSDSYRVLNDNSLIFRDVTLGNYDSNIKIVYTAGYTTTPEDLKLAVITEVVRVFKGKDQVGTSSLSLADGSTSYSVEALLDQTRLILNKYKRVIVS